MSGLCVAATVRGTGPRLRPFLEHHLSIGIDRIMLFFEDPRDPGLRIARRFPQVTVFRVDRAFQAAQRKSRLYPRLKSYTRAAAQIGLGARQALNLDTAISAGLQLGLDWIFSLDDDELLYSRRPLRSWLSAMPRRVGQVVFPDHEAAPETARVKDPFREVTLFKVNPVIVEKDSGRRRRSSILARFWRSTYFMGYVQGKPAARLTRGLEAGNIHRFVNDKRHPDAVWAPDDAYVLHYINSSFDQCLRKHRLLGSFRIGAAEKGLPSQLPFLERSRDALELGGARALRILHRKAAVYDDPAEVAFLLKEGVMFRNRSIAAR